MSKQTLELIEMEPLLISAKDAAKLCGLSERTWYSLISTSQAPPSIKISGRRLWRLDVIKKWIFLNCPPIDRFIEITKKEH